MHLSARLLVRIGLCALLLATGAGQAWAAETTKPARSGQSVYSSRCSSCHDFGMRGAPKFTDKAAWAPRLAQGKAKLYEHAIKGLGWMPSRGTCSTCTEDEIKAAVDYMLSRMS